MSEERMLRLTRPVFQQLWYVVRGNQHWKDRCEIVSLIGTDATTEDVVLYDLIAHGDFERLEKVK